MPALGVDLDLRLDGFGALMVLLVSGIGVAVYAYAYRYFSPGAEGLGRLAAMLTLFSGSMFGVVVADDLLVLYGFWELTSITSFLLIGNNHSNGRARAAALQALLVTSTGALAMLIGFVVLGQAAGTYRLSAILADPPSGTAVDVALALIALGAFTKSAQYPFHGWLPGAMVAPTPVSAYLHSATMVKAGVYLLARLSPAFAAVGFWRPLVVTRRPRHHDRRGPEGTAPDRPEVAARDGDREPARVHDRRVRARFHRGRGGGQRGAAGARAVQGRRVHGGRHRRPPARHPRPAPAATPRSGLAAHDRGHRGHRRVDGGRATRARVRREGGGARRVRARGRCLVGRRARGSSRRVGAHRRVQLALHDGRARTPRDVVVDRHPAVGRPRAALDVVRRAAARARRSHACCSASCPGCSTARWAPLRRASNRPSTGCTSRSGTGSTHRWRCRRSRSAAAPRCSHTVRGSTRWSLATAPSRGRRTTSTAARCAG